MSTFGKMIEISLFGESHGKAIGIVISNLPGGIKINFDRINFDLQKRRPKSNISTSRQEKDLFQVVSGCLNGYTTGSPLTFIIPNSDTRSKDYQPNILRPSHADYTAKIKYNSFEDYRGGGHFSGRITTPLVILGSICSQLLERKGIEIGSHVSSIKDCNDEVFGIENISNDLLKRLNLSDFPVINDSILESYKEIILQAKDANDSVGGTIETAIVGIEPGYGDPFFESIESLLSHLLFSIPAVKGVEFGKGFEITNLYGSEANDNFYIDNGIIKTKTNNSGGIQGGISNGMPILFKVAIKPTASIGKPQHTVDFESMTETTLNLVGRHDPSIVPRVIHVVNAITAYAVLELITRKDGFSWIK
ncbi:MAG: chorismate synthase [Bacilli bacterium]|nr:chorismate synthase [Bacilli bacterium]